MKRCKKATAVCMSIFMFCVLGIHAFAAVETPDLERKGSVKVTVQDAETKKPVTDCGLQIYQVADVREDDGNYTFEYRKSFSDCGYSLKNLQSGSLAKNLASYVSEHQVKGEGILTDAKGEVVFSDLELGLYLIVQETTAENYSKLNPFLVTVPLKDGEEYIYDVDASPKAGTIKKLDKPSKSGASGGLKKPVTKASVIPQTGQLWWPVPVLAILGMFFVCLGWMRRKSEKHA